MSQADAHAPAAHADSLTAALEAALQHPQTSPEFDLSHALRQILGEAGLAPEDSGGTIHFEGADPILPSRLRFGTSAALALAAKSVAVAALWRQRTGEGQDISVDVRKALRRFCGFFECKWETINGRGPSPGQFAGSPFLSLPMFRPTRDGRHVVALDFYPRLRARTLSLLRCGENQEAINHAIAQWRATDLEDAAAEAGVVLAMVRSNEEFRAEPQYREVLATMPLITLEKIGDSDPVPFSADPAAPLDGIRALGMGHVIAGGAIGRDLALYGADVLNLWRPGDSELEAFAWDAQVGMRSTVLDDSPQDRATFERLLREADIFFANKRPGFLARMELDAHALCVRRPGLIHASVVLHGEHGPWSSRPGFDEIGAAVGGVFALEGTLAAPKQPPIVPICDNLVGWLNTVGIIAALKRRAVEGGSYRVVTSLTRTVLWQLSLGIFDGDYARSMAGSSEQHTYLVPDLFSAQTPLGTYQGMTDQVVMSRTPGAYRTVLAPMGSSRPEWLAG